MSLPRLITTLVALLLVKLVIGESKRAVAADDAALATLFAEQHVSESALQVHRRAVNMPLPERLKFLSDWVLPGTSPGRIRLQVGFTPTHGVPVPGGPLQDGRMVEQGGEIVAPALDLIEAAHECGELETLREQVEVISAVSPEQQIEHSAMLALIAISMDDVSTSTRRVEKMFECLFSDPTLLEDAGDAVLLCVHRAGDSSELSRLVVDPAYQIVASFQDQHFHRSPWHRQFSAAYARAREVTIAEPVVAVDEESSSTADQWTPVSRKLAEHRGNGCPVAVWSLGPGRADNLSSHDDDFLYFQSPLLGDYSVECDVTGFGWRDSQLLVAGKWVGPVYDHQSYDIGTIRLVEGRRSFAPRLTRTKDYIRYRTAVRRGVSTTWFNGREIHNEQLSDPYEPWLAIRSSPRHEGGVRDLRVTGGAVIPDELSLSRLSGLNGWIPYYDDQVGVDWIQQGDEVQARHQQEYPAGCYKENLLSYQRPMLEDGSIEYDFWYVPDQFDAHPALDRLCFLLRPDGVRVHWVTDGRYERTLSSPENSVVESAARRGRRELPLVVNDWNHLRLTLRGDVVSLELNDQLICERTLESTNQRTFGLFHFADRTGLRVKNIVWRGDWPKELPPIESQQLARDQTDFLDQTLSELTATFEHDFARDGLAPSRLAVVRGDVPVHVFAEPDGLHARRPAVEGYRNATVAPRLSVSGDFDIQASFEGLVTDCHDSGSSNLMLIVMTGDEVPEEAMLLRRRSRARGSDQQLVQCVRVFNDGGSERRRYFDHLPVEAMAGTLRLARRGDQIYYLFAENDSEQFRLFGQEDFPTADLQLEGVRLAAQIHGTEGETRVIWKSLSIRAEGLSGVATGEEDRLLVQLNEQRADLAETFTHDFTQEPPDESMFRRWTDHREWSRRDGGLVMAAPGSDNWTSAGASLQMAIEGDFDVSARLDHQGLALPIEGEESTIYLQLELDDDDSTQISCIFKQSTSGSTEVVAQLRVRGNDDAYSYRRIGRLALTSLECLRLVRRGKRVYYLATSGDLDGECVVASADISNAPIRRDGTKLMVHTGGAGRTSRVAWKGVSVQADAIRKPDTQPQPPPRERSLLDLIFN